MQTVAASGADGAIASSAHLQRDVLRPICGLLEKAHGVHQLLLPELEARERGSIAATLESALMLEAGTT